MTSSFAGLTSQQRGDMLALAMDTIRGELKQDLLQESYDIPQLEAGLFVTLTRGGELRGCIGTFLPQPLRENLVSMANAAAFGDYRFKPVTFKELGELQVEITLLEAPRPVRAEEVEVGRHGLMVSLGHQRGVLLPQVATEHQWTREQFLEFTCIKAGLPKTAYKDHKCTIEVFEALIIT